MCNMGFYCVPLEIVVGFSEMSNSNGTEGESVLLCIRIFEGQLADNVTLSYLIGAPREESILPDPVGLLPDSAEGICNIPEVNNL